MGINRNQIRDGEIVESKLDPALVQAIKDDILSEVGVISNVATGSIVIHGGASAPTGYIIADGTPKSRTTYAALFAVYGTTHGAGDGSTTFGIPNLIDKHIMGAGNLYALGSTGGAATHTLSAAEMPSHTHTGPSHTHSTPAHTHTASTGSAGSHSHTPASGGVFLDNLGSSGADITTGGGGYKTDANTNTTGSHTHSVTIDSGGSGTTGAEGTGATGSAGSGSAHNNLPPYVALTPLIKT
jgi:microcystin-dependent protein